MQFSELKAGVKSIGFSELRKDSDNYLEAVIVTYKAGELCHVLETFLGPAVWPSENKLSPQIEDAIRGSGGIMEGQTLYFLRQDNNTLLTMLWPWGNGEHITVKIIQQ
ncbi:MAG: hypothetical protein KKH29_04240 [Candidatus Omnitrophica bacterium]|nr:hypothetical protein [Candidatus Omnitrophota bacterium]MBU4346519.1 hypothetical protein [Candidatus Omnitrophota bacterium]MBU4473499.1 hypothetical protein [Candidatus Omnitrophota bacterium]MCG2706788.1 hypothetical protein [Candidatus Omnitrophota bacterium]